MRSKKSKKKNSSPNRLWVVVAIVIVVAIITMTLSYFYLDDEKPDVLLIPPSEQQDANDRTTDASQATPIDGIWVSNYDGAILTLQGHSFTLELSGVDVSGKISGTLIVESNIVTFVNNPGANVCAGTEGHYLYTLEDNGDIFFKLFKDKCESRNERMTATWFKLE